MASFIMSGRLQAAIFIIISTLLSLLLPPLALFTNAAIALITLRKGWQQGVTFALLGSLLLGLLSATLKQGLASGFLAGAGSFIPIVFIASLLAFTKSWKWTLLGTLLLSCAGILLFHGIYPDPEAYWKPVLGQFKPMLKQLYQLPDKQIDEYIAQAAVWATGTFAAAFAIFGTLSLIIARNWQAMLYNPGGFSEEFRAIRLGRNASIAMLAGVLIAIISNNQIVIELIMSGTAVFMFQGLSLVHGITKKMKLNITWLIALYVLMFLLLIQMIVLLATFGIIDNFVDFRQKIANR